MSSDAERVKEAIDIVSFIGKYVPLKRAGRNFKGLCPFHQETNPSFTVSPERQSWHCFGCNRGGDIFTFLMEKENLDFPEALKFLAQQAGITLSRTSHELPGFKKTRLLEALTLAGRFYHYLLTQHKLGRPALEYLHQRQISNDSIKKFNLGYAPASWEVLGKFLLKRNFSPDELFNAGLIIKSKSRQNRQNWYDRFRQRIMFPLRDHLGRIVGFSGRALSDKQLPKYLNSPETPLFKKNKFLYGLYEGKDSIRKQDRVILVEGNVDIINAHQHEIDNVVAPLGTSFTENQIRLLKRFTNNFIVCFDSDAAGEKATIKTLELAQSHEVGLKVIQLTGGVDLDEVLKKDPESFKKQLQAPQEAFDYLIKKASARTDLKTARGKADFISFLFTFINQTPQQVVKSDYIKKIAEVLETDEANVAADLERIKKQRTTGIKSQGKSEEILPSKPKKSRHDKICELLFGLILLTPISLYTEEDYQLLLKRVNPDWFLSKIYQDLWVHLTKHLEEYKGINIDMLASQLPSSERQIIDLLLLKDSATIGDSEAFIKSLKGAVCELERSFLKLKLKQIIREIKSAETKENQEKIARLKKEAQEISKKLKNYPTV